MARVNVQIVLLVAVAAVLIFSPPVMASRMVIRQPIDKRLDIGPFFNRRGWNSVMCVPEVSHLIEDHEGRHKCAYDHENGYRAVGAGYNLDDNVDQKRAEVEAVAQEDYDKVYKGDSCLNDQQISGLLVLDAKRALERAERNVKRLNDFCCSVQAVFGDIQHSSGRAEDFPKRDLEKFIDEACKEEYESAADELGKTKWCAREANERRCDDNTDLVARGC